MLYLLFPRPITSSQASGRRLPAPPMNGTNGHTSPYIQSRGLPTEPRLPRQLPSTSRPNTANSSVSEVPKISMPLPEVITGGSLDWNSSNDYGSTVSRQPSARSAQNGYDDVPSRSPSSLDDMYASPDGHTPLTATPESVLSGYPSPEHMLRNQASQQRLPSLYAGSSCSYSS